MDKKNVVKDLLVSIKSGYSKKENMVYCKLNNFIIKILNCLFAERLILDFKIDKLNKVKIKLKYYNNQPFIASFYLLTKPSYKPIIRNNNIKKLNYKYDLFFLSTPYGVVSSVELKKLPKVGGFLLFGIKLT